MNLISVIIPVYNVEKYLPQCLDSVLLQSYKNIEVILVNDGSKDSSGAICYEYAKHDKRIQVIHQENKGLSAARNTGLDQSKGDFVYFLDSDDWIATDTIELLLSVMQKDGSDMVVGSFQRVSNSGESTEKPSFLSDATLSLDQAIASIHETVHLRIAWNKLYKKFLWETLRFPVGRVHEDEFTSHHILLQCQQISTVSYVTHFYRDTPGSIINTESTPKQIDRLDALEDRIQTLIQFGFSLSISPFEADWWHYFFILYPEIPKKNSEYLQDAERLYTQFLKKYKNLMKNSKVSDKAVVWMLRFFPRASCGLVRAKRRFI